MDVIPRRLLLKEGVYPFNLTKPLKASVFVKPVFDCACS